MAWTIECYAMPPVPCSVLALSSEGGIVEEVDKQLGPVVEELEKAQKVIVNAIARKGTGRASVRCSVGDLALLSDSMCRISWRMSLIYLSIAKERLLRRLAANWS